MYVLLSDPLHRGLCSSGTCYETTKTNSIYISNEVPAINREPVAGHSSLAKQFSPMLM